MNAFANFVQWLSNTPFYRNYMSTWPEPLCNVSFMCVVLIIILVAVIKISYDGVKNRIFAIKHRRDYEERIQLEMAMQSENLLMQEFTRLMLFAKINDIGSVEGMTFAEFKEAKLAAEREKAERELQEKENAKNARLEIIRNGFEQIGDTISDKIADVKDAAAERKADKAEKAIAKEEKKNKREDEKLRIQAEAEAEAKARIEAQMQSEAMQQDTEAETIQTPDEENSNISLEDVIPEAVPEPTQEPEHAEPENIETEEDEQIRLERENLERIQREQEEHEKEMARLRALEEEKRMEEEVRRLEEENQRKAAAEAEEKQASFISEQGFAKNGSLDDIMNNLETNDSNEFSTDETNAFMAIINQQQRHNKEKENFNKITEAMQAKTAEAENKITASIDKELDAQLVAAKDNSFESLRKEVDEQTSSRQNQARTALFRDQERAKRDAERAQKRQEKQKPGA